MSDGTKRVILLKPGDTLIIGNTGALDDELLAHIEPIKERLQLAQILIFEADIDIDAYKGDLSAAIAAEMDTRRYPS